MSGFGTNNPISITGDSMFFDKVVGAKTDKLSGSVSVVSSTLNTISSSLTTLVPNFITYFPPILLLNYTILNTSLQAFSVATNTYSPTYPTTYQYSDYGLTIYCSDSTVTQKQGLQSLSNYDTFSGGYDYYNTPSNPYVYSNTDLIHITNAPEILNNTYQPALASVSGTSASVSGVTFTYKFDTAQNFNGANLYFPTGRRPQVMYFFYSLDGNSWHLLSTTQYSGLGSEIYRWTFPSTFINNCQYYRLVVVSASGAQFDFGGSQFFKGTFNAFGSGTNNNLVGTTLSFNGNPFPIVTLVPIFNGLILNSSFTSIRCPLTFRISSNKMPVFSVGFPPESPIIITLSINGVSVYDDTLGMFGMATINGGSFDSTSNNGTFNSNFNGVCNEGDTIIILIFQYFGNLAKDMKLTMYSS